MYYELSIITKGQIKPKADLRTIDSPKKLLQVFFHESVYILLSQKNNFENILYLKIYQAPLFFCVLNS